MDWFNRGYKAEQEAESIFKKLFENVRKTEYQEFYDYLVSKGNLNLKIEVKYSHIPYKSGYIIFRWDQFKKLITTKDFLIYFMSNRGNLFISPEQLLEKGHLHYNEINPNEYNVLLRIKLIDNKLNVIEPKNCKFCKGVIKDVTRMSRL